MAVRNTEKRIPGGFDKASDLGQAVVSNDQNYALVSYLVAPLRQGVSDNYRIHIKNTYVVFVDTGVVPEPLDYSWTVRFYTDFYTDDAVPFFELGAPNPIVTIDGIFDLDTAKIPQLADQNLSHISISVEIAGTPEVLIRLEQDVLEPDENIESLFIESVPFEERELPISLGGHPPTTRLLANDYREFFIDQFPQSGSNAGNIPVNLVASLLYLKLLQPSLQSIVAAFANRSIDQFPDRVFVASAS